MQAFAIISLLLTLVGAFILAISNRLFGQKSKKSRRSRSPSKAPAGVDADIPPASGTKVLWSFAIFTVLFGGVCVWHYWDNIGQNVETLLFAGGLFLTMVFGMFAQVLATNYRSGKGLFGVAASQLLFPLLFGMIVYYPIWTIAASATRSLFSFYAAFLNGFFWESVVTSAKLPAPQSSNL